MTSCVVKDQQNLSILSCHRIVKLPDPVLEDVYGHPCLRVGFVVHINSWVEVFPKASWFRRLADNQWFQFFGAGRICTISYLDSFLDFLFTSNWTIR